MVRERGGGKGKGNGVEYINLISGDWSPLKTHDRTNQQCWRIHIGLPWISTFVGCPAARE